MRMHELEVKAAYLYKLADYVQWPAATFPSPTSPLTLCISGADPFGATLDSSIEGQDVAGRIRYLYGPGRREVL